MPNYDTDCQVSNLWTFKTPKPYKGPLRDEQGNALNGFKVQETKKSRKVSILCNGRYQRHYKFPKGLTVPKHPMNRWLNTPMCGIPLYDEDGNDLSFHYPIMEAVLEGKKPVGHIMFWNSQKEEYHIFLEKAKATGLEIFKYQDELRPNEYASIMVGVNKPLKELFDLDEIAQFYADGTGFTKDYFYKNLSKVKNLTPVKILLTYDWANPASTSDLMLTGLCLGYAFESTLSCMLQ